MFTTDDSLNYGMAQGCPVHGDDNMVECSVCGIEYCAACFQSDGLCKDCAAQAEDELSGKEPDFDDVESLDAILSKEELPDVPDER
ncbi:MAG TPA: hypothetical protein PKM67_03735 [Kiritimatiellia bacterium]|jgi:hypothetical protein|nr:hypothetical protein [Kiritimatiellia bacterium]HNS80549.1 hypothetical protein [Kiritimatiellia bacterium]HPA77142.1 hypothetical protein [Kiritimatiellia bacterium]HQQ03313.1 hypothetical protein [Kiritimatiellia bacterium]